MKAAKIEIQKGMNGLLGQDLQLSKEIQSDTIVVGTLDNSGYTANLLWADKMQQMGNEDYIMEKTDSENGLVFVIPEEYEQPENDLEYYKELEQVKYVPDPWYN